MLAVLGCAGSRDPDPDRDGIADDCVIPEHGLPADVFCTGLQLDRDPGQYVERVAPYEPGVTLWSDGAEKQRYLYLPPGTEIDTTDFDAWQFPEGTKAWKEFRFDGRLVETRLFWKRAPSEWASGTYIWDASGSDATLDTSRMPTIVGDDYEIPTAKDCGKCHHGGADKLLGIEAVALALPGALGVTLQVLRDDGRLSWAPSSPQARLPEDSTGRAAAALGYLHANCGMPCHSSRGLGDETQLLLRIRADEIWQLPQHGAPVSDATEAEAYAATVGVEPTTASVAQRFPGALRVTPGVHESSLLWLMTDRRDDYAMPPLVSHKVDPAGTKALAAWIDAMSP